MQQKIEKIIIIGSGPAGLTAAIYAGRAEFSPLVLAGTKFGGQLMLTTDVENYPGFPDGILGPDLMDKFTSQAKRFGANIFFEDVSKVDFSEKIFKVFVNNKLYLSEAVIIATGADANWLNLQSEQKLIGRGVSSCAPCDAYFFKEKKVVVIGGGDAAMEEALTLTKFASDVTIIHRREKLRASKIMQDRALNHPKIKFLFNSEILEVKGEQKVEGVKIKNNKNGQISDYDCNGMFVAIGHTPNSKLFAGQLELDQKGYIKKIQNPKFKTQNEKGDIIGNQYLMMTSVEGVFVAGDVHDYHYRQAVTAAAYGCMAAMDAEKWLESN
jgi:thioredoxin reductase (NADPH)